MKKFYIYTVKLTKLKEGGYGVIVPTLPDCHTWGETYEGAVANAEEAIQSFIGMLQKLGRPVPVENQHYRKVLIRVSIPATS